MTTYQKTFQIHVKGKWLPATVTLSVPGLTSADGLSPALILTAVANEQDVRIRARERAEVATIFARPARPRPQPAESPEQTEYGELEQAPGTGACSWRAGDPGVPGPAQPAE